ncbi:RHS repeat-associated core domain-containing protein [Goodfellowiella coeruleoviolacea]|uniref:RHS repeat-associated core domain-containing protein n=1 Tax=Goodfellowiella coeruleoviolacea TaxID=334858 RepID=UPI0020A590B1|nr:RHS repeat-associated core domain-containing protein [Goodfellowiella coeruleoviolacea]
MNPLVAQPQDSTTAFTGAGLLESAADLKSAIEQGDWAATALGAVDVGLSALGAVMDPFGEILAAGVGWLIEHVGPLKEGLNQLAGNPDEITAHAQTWTNVATELGAIATDLGAMVAADTAEWQGGAADAYRQRAADTVNLLTAAKEGAAGAASGVQTAGEVVAAVRGLVRDIIAELVGHLVSWALQVVATLGIGLTWVVPQVAQRVAETATQIARLTSRLVQALKALTPLLKRAEELFGAAAKALREVKPPKPTPPPASTREIPPPVRGSGGPVGGGAAAPPARTDTGDSTNTSGVNAPPRIEGASPPPARTDTGDSTNTSGVNAPPRIEGASPPPARTDTGDSTNTSGVNTPPRTEGAPPPPPPRAEAPPPPPPADGSRGGGGIAAQATPVEAHNNPVNNRPTCGDPIDVTTGWMILPQTDVELDSTLPLLLSRTHLSNYRLGRSFGRSWACTVDQRLEVDDTGVAFAVEDGTLLLYPLPADGQEVLPEQGPRWPLTRTASGGYAVLVPERDHILHFAAPTGRERLLSAISDANGRRVEFGRDEHGVVTEVVHSGGYRVRVDSQDGLITAYWLVGPGQDVLLGEFRYDAARRLTEVVNSSGQPLRFAYDDQERIVRCEDRNGMWYRYAYDAANRCVRAEGAGGYLNYSMEYAPGVTRATNSLGHTTVYELNERFQVVRETNPLGATTRSEWNEHHQLLSRTDPLGRTTSYRYDERGNLVAVTYPDGTQSLGEYDAANRLVTVVDPDGAVWRREYSPTGTLTAVADPMGGRTSYGYDELGNLRTVTNAAGGVSTYQVNLLGLVVSVTDPSGGTTRYAYDELGRKTQVVDPRGGRTLFTWTPEGRPASRVAPDGSRVVLRHDGEGNLRESVDALGNATRVEIGPFDLPTAEVRPDGSRLEFAYDTELRPVAVTNEHGQVWRYTYDPAGNLISEQDFDGRLVRYAYDAAGQLIARTNAAGQTVRYARDARGRVVARSQDGVTARLAYDGVGRLVRATTPDADLTITYDAAGRVLAEAVNGRVLASRYDALGRRISRRTPSGALSAWEHDPAGRPTALHTAGRTIRFAYDAAGHEVERRVGDGVLLAQQWDEADRLRAQTLVATLDSGTPAVLQRRSYRYRPDGRLVAVDDQLTGERAYDLDQVGRVTAVRGPHGTESYGYDPAGNVVRAAWHRGPDGQGPREYRGTLVTRAGNVRYGYDAEGRLVLREITGPGGRVSRWRYEWDAEDRLVRAHTPDGAVWRYGYDALGRRVWKQRLAADGAVVERIDFTWDGTRLAEQVRNGSAAVVWDWEPGTHRAISQTQRSATGQAWVDRRFQAIVTDLVGTPTELVGADGTLDWHQDTTLWGGAPNPAGTPLRFPGQYHDDETGLYYNVHRYYDPLVGRYASPDPLGLAPSANARAYVVNPTAATDPVGLMPVPCQDLNNQGHYPGDKTFAFTGYNQYQSGWTSPQGRYDSVPPQTIMSNSGTPFTPHNFDGGVPGRYNASHAELQAWNAQPGNPIVVTRPMCNSCQAQFQGFANSSGNNVYVGSPQGIHTFTPGGTPQTSLGHNEVTGVDAHGNPWKLTHYEADARTELVTGRPSTDMTSEWTHSVVYSDHSGMQYYHDPDPNGFRSYAMYYPNKNTEVLTEDANGNTVATTHIGPSGGTYDVVGGNKTTVGKDSRLPTK